jgi:hypothetical protein
MNNRLRLRSPWDVLAGGVLIMSVLLGGSWLGQVTAPYCPNRWIHFLVYAAVTSIPCAAWRTKRGVLCSLSVIGFSVVCGFFLAIAGRPENGLENVFSDLFGIAAGVLLGLNLRLMGGSANNRRLETKAAPVNDTLKIPSRPVRGIAGKPRTPSLAG